MAERVGFAPSHVVANTGLSGFWLPPDPPEPHESLGRRTYCARGAEPHAMTTWARPRRFAGERRIPRNRADPPPQVGLCEGIPLCSCKPSRSAAHVLSAGCPQQDRTASPSTWLSSSTNSRRRPHWRPPTAGFDSPCTQAMPTSLCRRPADPFGDHHICFRTPSSSPALERASACASLPARIAYSSRSRTNAAASRMGTQRRCFSLSNDGVRIGRASVSDSRSADGAPK